MDSFAEENPEIHEEIFATLKTPEYNKILSDDPVKDAARNYARAMKVVLLKKLTPSGNSKPIVKNEPLKGGKISIGSPDKGAAKPEAKLDPLVMDFIRKTKMKKESLETALEE